MSLIAASEYRADVPGMTRCRSMLASSLVAIGVLLTLGTGSSQAAITGFAVPGDTNLTDVAVAPDASTVWFTQYRGGIGRITPADGTVQIFTLGLSPDPGLQGIAAGPDGNFWFTEAGFTEPSPVQYRNKVGRITPSGVISEYTAFPNNNDPGVNKITAGPNGNLWYTGRQQIGRITPAGSVTTFTIPSENPGGAGITPGPDGNLWFSEYNLGGSAGRITTSGSITEFPLLQGPAGGDVYGPAGDVATGPDGNLWYTLDYDDKIFKISPAGERRAVYSLPAGRGLHPESLTPIVAAGDGTLWYAAGNGIDRITTDGQVSTVCSTDAFVTGFAKDGSGNVWFTSASSPDYVARATPDTAGGSCRPANIQPPPSDSDGDGVPDASDACPAVAGTMANGCPLVSKPDADGDGVPNASDACPLVAGTLPNGCPPAAVAVKKPSIGGPSSAGRVRVSSRGVFTVLRQTVACTGPGPDCAVKTSARRTTVKLGGSSFKVKAGTKGKIKVKLTRKGFKLLKRLKTIRAKVTITVTRGATRAKRTVKVTLKAPRSAARTRR